MNDRIDVLGLGCVAVDDMLYVAAFPGADSKTNVLRRQRQCGGLTATALVAAARLGARCAYAGVLGDDDLSRFVLQRLRAEGVDCNQVVFRPGARPVFSTIIVGKNSGTRNIFYDLQGAIGAADDSPPEEFITRARVLLVDHFGIEGMIRAARTARRAGIPVVADFERVASPQFTILLELVDHLVVSREFAESLTGGLGPPEVLRALWNPGRATVVVTCGAEGAWYLTRDGEPVHQQAFRVDAVDTTGCGDVFHGAYAAALAREVGIAERIRFASAAGALKACSAGGQAGIPNKAAVDGFLKTRPAPRRHAK